jgi:hypothetical protein
MRTDVSKEHIASIFREVIIRELETTFAVAQQTDQTRKFLLVLASRLILDSKSRDNHNQILILHDCRSGDYLM